MFEKFCNKLSGKDRFITVEITPSHGASISNIIDKIRKKWFREDGRWFLCNR